MAQPETVERARRDFGDMILSWDTILAPTPSPARPSSDADRPLHLRALVARGPDLDARPWVARGSEILISTGEVTSMEGPRVFTAVANRDYPTTLCLQSDEVDLTFDVQRIVYANDFLEMIPVVRSRSSSPW